jgi:hypothetical protein
VALRHLRQEGATYERARLQERLLVDIAASEGHGVPALFAGGADV